MTWLIRISLQVSGHPRWIPRVSIYRRNTGSQAEEEEVEGRE